MRHPKKTYPKVFSIFFGLLAAALILFLGWLSFQPTQLEEPSRTEDTKSDPADESSSAFSGQESDIEVSQSAASLEPGVGRRVAGYFCRLGDLVCRAGTSIPGEGRRQYGLRGTVWRSLCPMVCRVFNVLPEKSGRSAGDFLYRQRLSLVSVRLFLRALVQSVFSLFRP